jgi:hypothetical protein
MRAPRRTMTCALAVAMALILVSLLAGPPAGAASAPARPRARVAAAVRHDLSAPLRSLRPAPARPAALPRHVFPSAAQGSPSAPATPGRGAARAQAVMPSPSANFEGAGEGFTGPSGTYHDVGTPGDPNGAVGPAHYVQVVNTDLAIFSKTARVILGPLPTNTLWSGFGGACDTNDDGDATVLYDRQADRWVVTQLALPSTLPNLICVAVSTSGDPTGSYYRYAFAENGFPDYPKLGIWPDGYYLTVNMFDWTGNSFLGPELSVLDRAAMLAGGPATQQAFQLATTFNSVLPATVDSAAPPPAGSPEQLLSLSPRQDRLVSWRFHTDWATPDNTSLAGPDQLPVDPYSLACGGRICVPQPSTNWQLDSLGDRLMFRLAYRNQGGHESLVASHSVVSGDPTRAGSPTGVRWYELRLAGGQPSVYQQGTYAPDTDFRWMGSVAMDQSDDIGLGFSHSSSQSYPGVRYTGRLASDPPGTMPQGEGTIVDGTGSQEGSSRWGDYSSLAVDPADDCTFWYTNQYLTDDRTAHWRTRIGSFRFPSCGAGSGPGDFSLQVAPGTGSAPMGGSAAYSVCSAVTAGSPGPIQLGLGALPPGASGTFSRNPIPAGSCADLSIATASGTPAGNATFTVSGVSGSSTHTVAATLKVYPDFSLSLSPASRSAPQGGTAQYTVCTAVASGSPGIIQLTLTSAPAGVGGTFMPGHMGPGTCSTLTLNVSPTTPAGSSPIVVTGSSPDVSHSASASLTVVQSGFSISVTPSQLSIPQGGSGALEVCSTVSSGTPGPVQLAVAQGLEAGLTATFDPNPVTAGQCSTLTVIASLTAAPASTAAVVTGTSAGFVQSASASLVVTPAPPGCPGGALVCNLRVADQANASRWSIQRNLQVGNRVYGDHSYTFKALPAGLPGSAYVRTADRSKSFSGNPLVTLQLGAPATVYVGMDTRVARPSWLDASWADTGLQATSSTGTRYELFSQGFPAGSVSLGPVGSPAKGTSFNAYTVIVEPAPHRAAATAAVLQVPGQYPTIQAAIAAAAPGDTVQVGPGTYPETIDFLGKAITVVSTQGPAATVIDAGSHDRVVYFQHGEGPGSVLQGFTIQHGRPADSSDTGGGILIKDASPVVRGNVIAWNYACDGGGGISASGPALIVDNVIKGNISNCGGSDGGGITASNGVRMIGNTISFNFADQGGGVGGGWALLESNRIEFNVGLDSGGGIFAMGGGVAGGDVVQNLIRGNSVSGNGGGGGGGGGMYVFLGSGTPPQRIVNNTFADNVSGAAGSAVWAGGFDEALAFYNNVFAQRDGPVVYCDPTYDARPPVFDHNETMSIVAGGDYSGTCAGASGTGGNFGDDPRFVSSDGHDDHLQATSPGVNVGNGAAPLLPAVDLDGRPRVVGSGVDLGAYELQTVVAPHPTAVYQPFLPLSFGNVSVSSPPPQPRRSSVTVTNVGSADLHISSISFAGSNPGDFSLFADGCSNHAVPPGGTCVYTVAFVPTAMGNRTAVGSVASDDPAGPHQFNLYGTGV